MSFGAHFQDGDKTLITSVKMQNPPSGRLVQWETDLLSNQSHISEEGYGISQSKKTKREPEKRHVYYEQTCFPRFQYTRNLIEKCKSQVEMICQKSASNDTLKCDAMIKITYIGDIPTHLISNGKEIDEVPDTQEMWEASPIVCCPNERNLGSAVEVLSREETCHRFFVKSKKSSIETADAVEKGIYFIDQGDFQEAVTSCLEEPFFRWLDKWNEELKTTLPNKQAVFIMREIENIRKHMTLYQQNMVTKSRSKSVGKNNIVPTNVKDFLYRRDEVLSFGLWQNSCLKIFVRKGTNELKLRTDLSDVDKDFFEKHKVEFEQGKLVKKHTLMQGNSVQRMEDNHIFEGTIGGFVSNEENPYQKYALTCNHIFPTKNMIAYRVNSSQPEEIGTCVFTTREKQSDFAAIEINDTTECDVTFRNEKEEKVNACLYDGSIDDICYVHKFGAMSGLTTGSILSSEYYDKMTGEENFLVAGEYGQSFSEQGDSGALAFSKPPEPKQNYVNIVGMVSGTYQKHDERSDDEEKEHISNKKDNNGDVKSFSTCEDGKGKCDSDPSANSEHISCCYRIGPAMRLFQKDQCVSVKFKNDVLSPISSSEEK